MAGPFPTASGSYPVSGFANGSVTSAALVSSLTIVGTGLPTTPTVIYFQAITAAAFVDPFGGTPSASAGIPIPVGVIVPLLLKNPSLAKVASGATTALSVWW